MSTDKQINNILTAAKALARQYRVLTNKPLGITGEVAEFSAAKLLGLTLVSARRAGYDAVRKTKNGEIKIQIKGRCIQKQSLSGQITGPIQLDKEWDTVLLVVLNEDLEVRFMYEADRRDIEKALLKPGSKSRKRGVLPLGWFKSHGRAVYNS